MNPRKKGSDWPALVESIRAGAAYLGQGISYSYLRARTLLAGPKLFSDADFGFALTICKWEAFGVAAQDLILMIEADHRDGLNPDPARRASVLLELYKDVLASEPVPEHRQDKGWSDLVAAFETRLESYMNKPPLGPDGISIATAMAVLDNAPIESAVRDADQMMVVNNTAFRFIEYQAKMRKALDIPAIMAELDARMSA
nr:esterase [Pelagibacterium limicola]